MAVTLMLYTLKLYNKKVKNNETLQSRLRIRDNQIPLRVERTLEPKHQFVREQ